MNDHAADHLLDATGPGLGPAAAALLGGAHQGEGPPVVGEVVDVEDRTVPCLGQYVTAWRRVTSQPFVLQAVVGYRLDFVRRSSPS